METIHLLWGIHNHRPIGNSENLQIEDRKAGHNIR